MSKYSDLLIEYLRNYNIWFLSILIILQCIGIPTGATLLVIASGAFAYAGEFNIFVLLLEVWFFSSAGDIFAYTLWKIIGQKTLMRFSKLRTFFMPKLSKMQTYLDVHGKGAVFITRFLLSGIGPLINAAAGISKYGLYTFSLFVILGELLWSCMYLGIGYWFADSFDTIVPVILQSSEVLTCFFILIVIVYFIVKLAKA